MMMMTAITQGSFRWLCVCVPSVRHRGRRDVVRRLYRPARLLYPARTMNARTRDIVDPGRRPGARAGRGPRRLRRGPRPRRRRSRAPGARARGHADAAGGGAAPAPQYERWTVGIARRPITVSAAGRPTRPCWSGCPMRTPADYPTVVLVDEVREVDGVPWYRVWLAVPAQREPRLGARRPDGLLHDGLEDRHRPLAAQAHGVPPRRARCARFPSPWDAPASRRPRALLRHAEAACRPIPNGVYGVLQLGTSATQPKLNGWPDGGLVAIHGTNEPWLIGKAISHGCVRMKNAAVEEVSRLVPTGAR